MRIVASANEGRFRLEWLDTDGRPIVRSDAADQATCKENFLRDVREIVLAEFAMMGI
jgi:hypothetical protein